EVGSDAVVLVDLGDEVYRGDVEEAASGEGDDVHDFEHAGEDVRCDAAQEEAHVRQGVVDERLLHRPSAVHQQAEIPHFLWQLVGCRDEPGHDAEANVDDERRSDGNALDAVVYGVGDQEQVGQRVDVFGRRLVVMVLV